MSKKQQNSHFFQNFLKVFPAHFLLLKHFFLLQYFEFLLKFVVLVLLFVSGTAEVIFVDSLYVLLPLVMLLRIIFQLLLKEKYIRK